MRRNRNVAGLGIPHGGLPYGMTVGLIGSSSSLAAGVSLGGLKAEEGVAPSGERVTLSGTGGDSPPAAAATGTAPAAPDVLSQHDRGDWKCVSQEPAGEGRTRRSFEGPDGRMTHTFGQGYFEVTVRN